MTTARFPLTRKPKCRIYFQRVLASCYFPL